MRIKLAYIFLFISISLFWVSCKKENETFPSISQLRVNQSGSYEFGDTIIVEVTIKDVEGPVRLAILQGAGLHPLPTELFSKRGDDYTYLIYVNDKYYESGSYSIRVQAFNGENGVSDFRDIRINGLQKAIRGLCYLGKTGPNSILYKIDSLGIQSQTTMASEVFQKIVADSRSAQILALPQTSGLVKALKFNDLTLKFESNFGNSSLEFENLYQIDGNRYVLLKDGRVFTIGSEGQSFLAFILADNFLAQKMAFFDDRMLISAQKQGTLLYELFLLRKANNSILQRTFVSAEPIEIVAINSDRFYMIYRKSANTVVAEYNATTGLITEKYTVDNEAPKALALGNGMFYLATDQNIYTFPANSFQFPQMLFSFGADQLLFDDVNDEMYILSSTNIWKVPIGSNQNQFVANSADPFLSVGILYNK